MFPTLLEILPRRAEDQAGTLKRICSVTTLADIKIHGGYFLFGRYDETNLFETPDLKTAKDFILHTATHLYKTETLMALPAEEL